MRTPRVFLLQPLAAGGEIDLPPQESFHVITVLRRVPGDDLLLHGPDGRVFRGRIAGAGAGPGGPWARVSVLDEEPRRGPPVIPWTAAVALAKADAFELAIRMASELGLEGVQPVVTERSIARPMDTARKVERWTRVALEAAKQCGRATPLAVAGMLDLPGLIAARDTTRRRWIALPGGPSLDEGALAGHAAPSTFLVGPEGGFTPREVALAVEAGFRPLGFPTPVLRTPTAVALIAALGLLAGGGADPGAAPQTPA